MVRKASLSAVLSVLIGLSLCLTTFVDASSETSNSISINADGSVTGTSSILRDENVYTLMGNISGGIQVHKSYVVIDGAGYTIDGGGQGIGVDLGNGVGRDPSRASITNVTVKNLKIINFYYAIGNEKTGNNSFVGNYIAGSDTGFWIIGSANNTLIRNTVRNCTTGVSINYGSGANVIEENNICSSFSVWLSPPPLVDRNYWSDYLTRYPNAKEIDSSGIWDTPYNRESFIDNHPLTEPVAVSLNTENPALTPSETLSSSPAVPESTTWATAILILIITASYCRSKQFKKLEQIS
jgi:parallel beta-helix repeat protein